MLVQANDTLHRDCLKAKPRPAKPSSIIAHVEVEEMKLVPTASKPLLELGDPSLRRKTI